MIRYAGDGFHNHTGSTSKKGPPMAYVTRKPTIDDRIADGVHVALIRMAGGFPVANASRGRLLLAIDACLDESGSNATRRLLLQAARTLR